MTASALEALLRRDRLVVAASLAAVCLIAWLFLVHLAGRMEAMDGTTAQMGPMGDAMDMPGRPPAAVGMAMDPEAMAHAGTAASFGLVALMWAVMMVGMMLPSAAPTILLFAGLERRRAGGAIGGRIALFVAGYFAMWGIFSVVAAAAQTGLAHAGLLSMRMAATSTGIAGGIVVLAGLYEFTPLKDRCLTHCRSPLEWLPRHMRSGRAGAFRMGIAHGAYCVGCCWVLMLLLFAGGVMNLVWVAGIAALVLAQKILPGGPVVARLGGAVLVLGGVVLMVRPLLSA